MLKRIVFALLLLSICLFAKAQDEFQKEWSFGVNAGAALSKISFTPNVPQTFLPQFTGGVSARYIAEKYFGLQLELNYSMRGWEESRDEGETEYSRSLSYIEFPAMTHIYFDLSKRARLVFNIGPQISYCIGEKELKKEIVNVPEKSYYEDKVQHLFDYGIVGGGGVELRTGIGSFVLDGRYYFGLRDIFNNEKSDATQKSLNQVIGIKLTYFWN